MSRNDSKRENLIYAELARQYSSGRPVNRALLDYAAAEERHSRVPTAVQFILGMLFPAVYGTVMFYAGTLFSLIGIHVLVIAAIAVLLRIYARWNGFLPGVIVTICLTPVVFFVLCMVVLSNL